MPHLATSLAGQREWASRKTALASTMGALKALKLSTRAPRFGAAGQQAE
jgi:hypothetical protein